MNYRRNILVNYYLCQRKKLAIQIRSPPCIHYHLLSFPPQNNANLNFLIVIFFNFALKNKKTFKSLLINRFSLNHFKNFSLLFLKNQDNLLCSIFNGLVFLILFLQLDTILSFYISSKLVAVSAGLIIFVFILGGRSARLLHGSYVQF